MTEDKMVAKVIDYIAAFSPEAAEKSLGADDALIHDFDGLVKEFTGFYLPFEYFEFLQVVGFEQPIDFADDAKMNIDDLYEYYRMMINDGEKSVAENSLIIASGGYNTEQITLECIVFDGNENTKSGRVHHASGGYLTHVIADSFVNFLYRRAFESFASSHLPVDATYNTDKKDYVLPEIANLMKQFGWQKQWFSDSVALCFTEPNNEMVLVARQSPPKRPPWVRIAGRDKKQISLVGNQVCRVAGLQQEKWWT